MFCFLWITGISRHVTLGGLPYFFSQQTSFKIFYIYSAPLNIQPYNCFYFILIWKNRARKQLRKTGWKHINFSHLWNEFLFQTRWNCNRTFHKWEHGRFSVSSVRSSLQSTEAETVTDSSLNMNNILQKMKVPLSIWRFGINDKEKNSHIKSVSNV